MARCLRSSGDLFAGYGSGRIWRLVPSGGECLTCHTAAVGFALGLETAQLNKDFTYASTGRTANQLRTLDAISMFTTPLGDPALRPAMPDPFDAAGVALLETCVAGLTTCQ